MQADDLRHTELIRLDPVHGFPLFGASRTMLVAMASLARLQNDLVHSLGHTRMPAILARFGYECGLTSALAVAEQYDFENKAEWLKAGSVLCRLAGVAVEELTDIRVDLDDTPLGIKGIWRDSFESTLWKQQYGTSPEPVCHLLAGLASGFASVVSGREILVRELSCQAQGGECCRFEGRLVQDWGLSLQAVRQYFKVENLDAELERHKSDLSRARLRINQQKSEIDRLRTDPRMATADPLVQFRSPALARVLALADKIAPSATTVLLQGESGSGKEVLAEFIHRHSGRADAPFLVLNCAALPASLIESELFGYVKGAFTGADHDKTGLFAAAQGGTLFLDEVGDLPMELQAKLLRAIEKHCVLPVGGIREIPIEARIIAATHQDLKKMVAENRFRQDLYYRLAVIPILLPPLRERREDILPLARHFLSRISPGHPGFEADTVRILERYCWPGNVRELENWIEYAVAVAGPEQRLGPQHLPEAAQQEDPLSTLAHDWPTWNELQQRYTRLVLDHTRQNRTQAARILGTSVTTLWRRLGSIPNESSEEMGSSHKP